MSDDDSIRSGQTPRIEKDGQRQQKQLFGFSSSRSLSILFCTFANTHEHVAFFAAKSFEKIPVNAAPTS